MSGLSGIKIFGKGLAVFIITTVLAIGCEEAFAAHLTAAQPACFNKTGIDNLKVQGLSGKGIEIGILCRSETYIDGKPQNDYRPDRSHNSLKTSRLKFADDGLSFAGVSDHATAIASIFVGRDTAATAENIGAFAYEGVCPDATLENFEFWHFLKKYVFPLQKPGQSILSMSFGYQFEDWWTRGIDALAEKYNLTVIAGIGNGSDAFDGPLYPAANANVIAVGVMESADVNSPVGQLTRFALPVPQHSSTGPTDAGLCKPDIIAPGNCLAAVAGEPNTYEPTGDYSSYAAPIVAGVAGLLTQKAQSDANLAAAIDNRVLRSILMTSAVKLPYWQKGRVGTADDHNSPLDYIQGAGLLNAAVAYDILSAGRQSPGHSGSTGWDRNIILPGSEPYRQYGIESAGSSGEEKYITATLVWNRRYEHKYPFEPVGENCDNLRLELWGVDANSNTAIMLDYSDSAVDNVEHIRFPIAADGTLVYKLIVRISPNAEKIDMPAEFGLSWRVAEADKRFDSLWYDLNADGKTNATDLRMVTSRLSGL